MVQIATMATTPSGLPHRRRGPGDGKGRKGKHLADAVQQVDLPEFSSLMREMYKKGHPDIVRSADKAKSEINDNSFQVLNGILTTIKTTAYPPQIIQTIPFYLKTETGLRCTELHVKTAGGECKRQVTKSFSDFFIASGIAPSGQFKWSKEYFPVTNITDITEEKQ